MRTLLGSHVILEVAGFAHMSGRTVAHFTIFSSPIQIPFLFCSILFCIQLCKAHTTRVHMDVYTPIRMSLNGDYCSRK